MQVVDRLATIGTSINNNAVSVVQPFVAGQFRGFSYHVPQQRRVLLLCMSGGCNMLLGNNQQMRRRLRVDVGKAQALVVLEHTLGRDAASDNLAEETIGTHEQTSARDSKASYLNDESTIHLA
jgi:hypothetical protein